MNKMLKYLLIGGAAYLIYRSLKGSAMSGLGDPNSEGSSGSEAAALDFARQSGGGTTVVTVPSGGSFMQKMAQAPVKAIKKAEAPFIAKAAFDNPNDPQARQALANNEMAKKIYEAAIRGQKKIETQREKAERAHDAERKAMERSRETEIMATTTGWKNERPKTSRDIVMRGADYSMAQPSTRFMTHPWYGSIFTGAGAETPMGAHASLHDALWNEDLAMANRFGSNDGTFSRVSPESSPFWNKDLGKASFSIEWNQAFQDEQKAKKEFKEARSEIDRLLESDDDVGVYNEIEGANFYEGNARRLSSWFDDSPPVATIKPGSPEAEAENAAFLQQMQGLNGLMARSIR